MTAPATSHDLRCPALNGSDPGVPCMCARGASVVRLHWREGGAEIVQREIREHGGQWTAAS